MSPQVYLRPSARSRRRGRLRTFGIVFLAALVVFLGVAALVYKGATGPPPGPSPEYVSTAPAQGVPPLPEQLAAVEQAARSGTPQPVTLNVGPDELATYLKPELEQQGVFFIKSRAAIGFQFQAGWLRLRVPDDLDRRVRALGKRVAGAVDKSQLTASLACRDS